MATPRVVRPMREKWKKLVYYYCGESNFDKLAAMKAAGYDVESSKGYCSELFNQPEIKRAIAKRMEKISQKHGISKEWLIGELVRVITARDTLAKFIVVTSDGELEYDFTTATKEELALLAGFENTKHGLKIINQSAEGAMERLIKLMGWNSPDKVEVSGKDGGPIELSDMELARKVAFIMNKAGYKAEAPEHDSED